MPAKNILCIRGWFLGDMQKVHMGFLYFAPALAMIARRTGSYNIRPDVLAAHVAWEHVIHRQPVIALPTILAGIIITPKHFTAR